MRKAVVVTLALTVLLAGCAPKIPKPLAEKAAQYTYYVGTQEIFEVQGEDCTSTSHEPTWVEVTHYRSEGGDQQLYVDTGRSEIMRVTIDENGHIQNYFPHVRVPENLFEVTVIEHAGTMVMEGRLKRELTQWMREGTCVSAHWRIEAQAKRDRYGGLATQMRYEETVMDFQSRSSRWALHDRDREAMKKFIELEGQVYQSREALIDTRLEALKERSESSHVLFGTSSVIDARFRYEYAQALFERDGPGDLAKALLHNEIALLVIRRHLGEESLKGRLYAVDLLQLERRYRADHDLRRYAYLGDVAGMQAALKAGAKIDAASENGMSALLWAAYSGQHEAAQLLLAQGANIEQLNQWGYSPLAYAALSSEKRLFETLMVAGARTDRHYVDPAGANPFDQPTKLQEGDRYTAYELAQIADRTTPVSVAAFDPARLSPEALQAQAAQLIRERAGSSNPSVPILKLEKLLLYSYVHGVELDLAALRTLARRQRDSAAGQLVNLFRPTCFRGHCFRGHP